MIEWSLKFRRRRSDFDKAMECDDGRADREGQRRVAMNPVYESENFKVMRAAGFVVSPNNVWSQPGVAMYAGSPGIMTWKDSGLKADIQVTDKSIYVFKPVYDDGKFQGLRQLGVFDTAAEFLAHVAAHGVPSEPGLPAFSNSWD